MCEIIVVINVFAKFFISFNFMMNCTADVLHCLSVAIVVMNSTMQDYHCYLSYGE